MSITADDWELITDALLRTADAHEEAGQKARQAGDDARRNRMAALARTKHSLAVEHFRQRDAMKKLAMKIARSTPDDLESRG